MPGIKDHENFLVIQVGENPGGGGGGTQVDLDGDLRPDLRNP